MEITRRIDSDSREANLKKRGQELIEASGPDIYRKNAFRILCLPVDAGHRDVDRQIQKINLMKRLGRDRNGFGGPLSLDGEIDSEVIGKAKQRLEDPEMRLVDEFFWFWPIQMGNGKNDEALKALENNIDGASEIWHEYENGGGHSNVSTHNFAILSHVNALDWEYEGGKRDLTEDEIYQCETCWKEAYKRWKTLMKSDRFWLRLKSRILDLKDPRLTVDTANQIRESLPLVLLAINARLAVRKAEKGNLEEAGRQRKIMAKSGFDKEHRIKALRLAVDPVRKRIKMLCKHAEEEVASDAECGYDVAKRLIEQVKKPLEIVEAVFNEDKLTLGVTYDEVASQGFGCIIKYGNSTDNWKETLEVLKLLLPIARGNSILDKIKQNIETVERNLVSGLCWFCQENKPNESASVAVPMHGNVTRTPTWQGELVNWKKLDVSVPRCKTCKKNHAKPMKRDVGDEEGSKGAGYGFLVGLIFAILTSAFGGASCGTFFWASIGGSVVGWISEKYPSFGRALVPVSVASAVGIIGAKIAISRFGITSETSIYVFIVIFLVLSAIGIKIGLNIGRKVVKKREKAPKEIQTKPESHRFKYPLLKELQSQGWEFGDKPAGIG